MIRLALVMLAALTLVGSCAPSDSSPPMALSPFLQNIPGFTEQFEMVPVSGKFYISRTEITWNVFDIYAFELDRPEPEKGQATEAYARPSRPYFAHDRGFGHDGYPVIGITAHSAKEFCKWLSLKTGRNYRLPTEGEWELAAGGGAGAPANILEVAWCAENAEEQTHPVGKLKPNEFGLYDMLGNAGEWAIAADGTAVLRGGHYKTRAGSLSHSTRELERKSWNLTDPADPKSIWWYRDATFTGFRVVCELTASN